MSSPSPHIWFDLWPNLDSEIKPRLADRKQSPSLTVAWILEILKLILMCPEPAWWWLAIFRMILHTVSLQHLILIFVLLFVIITFIKYYFGCRGNCNNCCQAPELESKTKTHCTLHVGWSGGQSAIIHKIENHLLHTKYLTNTRFVDLTLWSPWQFVC